MSRLIAYVASTADGRHLMPRVIRRHDDGEIQIMWQGCRERMDVSPELLVKVLGPAAHRFRVPLDVRELRGWLDEETGECSPTCEAALHELARALGHPKWANQVVRRRYWRPSYEESRRCA